MTEFEKTMYQLHSKCNTILIYLQFFVVSIEFRKKLNHRQNIKNVGGTEQYSLTKTELHSV